jgi:hypothetical protein
LRGIIADSRAALDGPLDIVFGHVFRLGLVDNQAQAEVEVGIAAVACRQLQLARQLGEYPAALRIGG